MKGVKEDAENSEGEEDDRIRGAESGGETKEAEKEKEQEDAEDDEDVQLRGRTSEAAVQDKGRRRSQAVSRTRLTLASHQRPQVTTPKKVVRQQAVHVMQGGTRHRKGKGREHSDEGEKKKWEAAKAVLNKCMMRLAEIAMKCKEAKWEPNTKVSIRPPTWKGNSGLISDLGGQRH